MIRTRRFIFVSTSLIVLMIVFRDRWIWVNDALRGKLDNGSTDIRSAAAETSANRPRRHNNSKSLQEDSLDARLVLISDQLDLGKVDVDADSSEFTVELWNRSNIPVNVIRTEASCGCTRLGDLSKNPIPAGEKANLKGTVKLSGTGVQRAFVRVFVEGQAHVPTAFITWEPFVGVTASVRSLYFATIEPGKSQSRTVTLTSTAGQDLRKLIRSVNVVPTECLQQTVEFSGNTAAISVTLVDSGEAGSRKGTLEVILDGKSVPMRIPVEWTVREPLGLEPKSVFRGRVECAHEIVSSFIVREIDRVELDSRESAAQRFRLTSKPLDGGIFCEVRCLVPDVPGAFNLHVPLIISKKDGSRHERSFRISGMAAGN